MIIRFVPDFLVSWNAEAFTEIGPRGGISHHPTITPGPNPPEIGRNLDYIKGWCDYEN